MTILRSPLPAVLVLAAALSADARPPKGFTALFNGKNLDGWYGRGTDDPKVWDALSPDERAKKIEASREDIRQHWRVEKDELVNDGNGLYLTTDKDYGDFEFHVEYKTVPLADSGIYLRGIPQVQIWDPTEEKKWPLGADKGSGGLWNNPKDAPGKDPLVKADRPFGEWNSFRIRMVGERVTVHLNDKLVVDDAVLHNLFAKDPPAPVPARGPIQLQTHGGEIRWRNVYVREIPADEANAILAKREGAGFQKAFNGKDLTGWVGATADYEVKDGAIRCREGKGGNLFLKDEYGDFAFRFEFKLPPGGNNGLGIRAPLEGNVAYSSMELQILDDGHPKYKDLKPWQVHGSVYGVKPAHRGYLRPAGEWNFEEVVADGTRLRITLNGTTILDEDLAKLKPVDDHEHPGLLRPSGYVGFAGHNDPVEFRNIQVKRLK